MTVQGLANMNFAARYVALNTNRVQKAFRPLSSGYRINSAADDAAGLAISQRMRGQLAGLEKATQNAVQGSSLIKTAEGTLDSTSQILTRMQELAVQSSNGTYTDSDRALLNKEFQSLKEELDRVSSSAHYNGKKLLDGSLGERVGEPGLASMGISRITACGTGTLSGDAKFTISTKDGITSITAEIGGQSVVSQVQPGEGSALFDFGGGNRLQLQFASGGPKDGVISNVAVQAGEVGIGQAVSRRADAGLSFQIGANGNQDQRLTLNVNEMSSAALGIADLDIGTLSGANGALDAIRGAVDKVNGERAGLGAIQNRLESAINHLGVTTENMYASESRIRDADMAESIMNLTQRMIQQQSSVAMMAQSMNISRQNILGLILR